MKQGVVEVGAGCSMMQRFASKSPHCSRQIFQKSISRCTPPTILAYSNRRQCCPNCMLPNHSLEECALFNGKPVTNWSSLPREDGHSRHRDRELQKKQSKKGACYSWNDGKCINYPCPYEHVCSRCFGDHKRYLCGSSFSSKGPESKVETKISERND